MSPTNHTTPISAVSHTSVDAIQRHEFGIQKNRKTASTGGGRAWSEEEESYLLQTRLQKMPYKHIASHIKKTELACRLHYHQLSHSSTRRKRTNSMTSSSDSSSVIASPLLHETPSPMSTPLQGPRHLIDDNRLPSLTPSSPMPIQLPSATTFLPHNSPPRPLHHIPILPKPLTQHPTPEPISTPSPLRLNCNLPCTTIVGHTTIPTHTTINRRRLRALYAHHAHTFWSVIASEYGNHISPTVLEEAWRRDVGAPTTPMMPCTSPREQAAPVLREAAKIMPEPSMQRFGNRGFSATSIKALLGIDASPRSPEEREMIRRMEEARARTEVACSAQ